MAQIVLSGNELVRLLRANALIPDQVTDVEMDGVEIRVRVRTPWPVLKSVHVRVRFAGFEGGHIVLQLGTNRVLDKFDWLVDKMLVSLQLEDHGGRWEYPRLYVDVNKLLQRQVRGVKITEVVFREDRFHITTRHSVDGKQPTEPASDEQPDFSCAGPDEV
jgi:hypothetical protein